MQAYYEISKFDKLFVPFLKLYTNTEKINNVHKRDTCQVFKYMKFITNGPDIPEEFLQAHEEGRVVFFCGSGISHSAGLQDFRWLVSEIYRLWNTDKERLEENAFKKDQFDTTLNLLEERLPGGRPGLEMRKSLASALKPNLRKKGALDTHSALLTLGLDRNDTLRLVTTNFDRVFHAAAKRTKRVFKSYAAPLLPVPKKSRWNGLVFLHGLLTGKADDGELNRLVITSSDFGLAYLTERWAARFVSELFRNYEVCFIGYSISDPVLRYMMDALAADRMLGEYTPKAWAFGECQKGKEKEVSEDWQAKGVTPILYSNPTGTHIELHQTLAVWAAIYRDGVSGKEQIVVRNALASPAGSTNQDEYVARMLWALSEESGLPAKRFANYDPAPSLEWLLDAFADERYRHSDLARFDVHVRERVDSNPRFSLINRPAPYDKALPMLLVSRGNYESQWDEVMYQLARWLVRHLDDPRLIIWIAERGGQLHDSLSLLVEEKLFFLADLQLKGKTFEIDEILLNAPKAIPSPPMRTLWRLLLSGRVKPRWNDHDLSRWKGSFQQEGLTATLRFELRKLLAPKIVINKKFKLDDDDANSVGEPKKIGQLVDWELELATDHVITSLRDRTDEHWRAALPELLDDFQQLLRDALDLLRELGAADDRYDRSHWDLPSISEHSQNRGFRTWVSLIELLRDAWVEVHANNRARAAKIARNWFELPYPTFKRLALFAASKDDCVPPDQWVGWLISDGAWWLWSVDTRREVLRLFVLQGRNLSGSAKEQLEAAILLAPPHEMYSHDLEPNLRQDSMSHSVWLPLAKLNFSGMVLGKIAAARFEEISTAYPQWHLATNESDEFSIFMSGTGDSDYENSRDVDNAPRKWRELVEWLEKPKPKNRPFYEDTWRDVCRERFFHCLWALRALAEEDKWPDNRWREALQVWAEEGMILRSWQFAAPLVQTMPEADLLKICHTFTRWIQAASKSINRHEDILLILCRRVLTLPLEIGSGSVTIRNGIETYDPVGSAINHPIGHVTQTLINLWFKLNPNDNDLLPDDLTQMFTSLCDINIDRFRHGRVILGSRLIAFFRVDRLWTEQHLLPLFDWSNPLEAKAMWEGFLWSPRLYQPLLAAFKAQFLGSANHYSDLGQHGNQFAAFLTYVALDQTQGYTVDEFQSAITALPREGLERCAETLYQAVASAADQRENYWNNRAKSFWLKIWPKSDSFVTPRISEFLALMSIAARGEFPAAFSLIRSWLVPIENPYTVIHALKESSLCERFPDEALFLLSSVIDDQRWGANGVDQCLNQIEKAAPQLKQNPKYVRLREYYRRRSP